MTETTELLVFNVDNIAFAIDSNDIETIEKNLKTSTLPSSKDYIDGLIHFRGKVFTQVNLCKYLFKKDNNNQDKEIVSVVCNVGENQIAFRVDDIRQIVKVKLTDIMEVGDMLVKSAYMLNGFITTEDGSIVQILDIKSIYNDMEKSEAVTADVIGE